MRTEGYWTSVRHRRLSRRQILGSAALGGAGIALAACGQAPNASKSGTPTTGGKAAGQAGAIDKIAAGHYERVLAPSKEELNAAQTAKRGGTMKFQYLDPPHFDISLVYSCTLYDTHSLVYNRALRPKLGATADPFKLELEPDLAEKWEQPAKDASEFVFTFRKNVKWLNKPRLNGRPFTAEDAKMAFERYQAGGVQKDLFSFVDKWEMPDQYTLHAKLKEPYVDFPASISTAGFITPRELWMNSDAIKRETIGTGPFIRESWTPKQGSVWVRNPDYWEMGADGKPLPYVDRVEAFVVDDFNTQKSGFITRDWYQYAPPSGKDADDAFKATQDTVWLDIPQSRGGNVNNFLFNMKNPRFQDKRVRNAISMGIDRIGVDRLLYDSLNEGYTATAFPWPFVYDQQPKLDDQGAMFQYNPDQAKQLLKAAGAENLEFELIHWYMRITAPVIQDMLKQIGVKVNIKQVDNPTAVQLTTSHNFQDTINGVWGPPNFSVDGWLYPFYITDGSANYNFVSDPDLDTLLKAQRREADAGKRKDILKQIDKRLNDQNYDIWWPQSWYREQWPAFVKNYRVHGFMGTATCYSCGQITQVWVDK